MNELFTGEFANQYDAIEHLQSVAAQFGLPIYQEHGYWHILQYMCEVISMGNCYVLVAV